MKDAVNLVWLTQLGLSVAAPLAGFVLLAVWLRDTFSLGSWVLWIGVAVGILTAVNGLLHCLQALTRNSRKKDDAPPPVSYNDHA